MEQQLKRVYPNRMVRSRAVQEMELTEDHIGVLRLFLKHRYLTATEIGQLLKPQVQRIYPKTLRRQGTRAVKPETLAQWEGAEEKRTEKGTVYLELAKARNPRRIKEWLKAMFYSGYITRRPQRRGEWLHSLSNEGALALEELGELESARADWDRYNREPGGEHVDHTRMISRVRAALNLALPREGKTRFEDEKHWRPESKELRLEVWLEDRERPVVVRPDGFFQLQVPGGRHNFFLEVVRHNTERRRFLPKLQAYWHGRADYYERLGIRRYRVLILARSEARRDNVVRMIQKQFNDEQGSGLFLVGAEFNSNPHARIRESERCFSVERPESILAPIWKCGRTSCTKWHSLVE